MREVMSRKGWLCTLPPFTSRILPAFSTMKMSPLPSPESVKKTG